MVNKHRKKGGYSSASDYTLKTFGTGDQQYNNVFRNTAGQNLAQINSNSIATLKDPNSSQVPYIGPQLVQGGNKKTNSILHGFKDFYRGGKRRRRTKRRKGGFIGSAITQAAVPFALLGLRESYKKNHQNNYNYDGYKNTRRNRFRNQSS